MMPSGAKMADIALLYGRAPRKLSASTWQTLAFAITRSHRYVNPISM